MSIRLQHDDNVNFTPSPDFVVSDTVLRVSGETEIEKRLSPFNQINFVGRLDVNEHVDCACDHIDFALGVVFKKKMGIGLQAPRLSVAIDGEFQNYEVSLRDVFATRLTAAISKPVHERVDLAFTLAAEMHGALYEQASSRSESQFASNPFDRSFIRAELSSLIYLDANWSLPVRLSYLDGDLLSISRPDSRVLAQADAASDYSEITPGTIAYRSEGDATSFGIGLSRVLNERSEMNFSYTAQSATTGANTKYSRDLISLEYTIRW